MESQKAMLYVHGGAGAGGPRAAIPPLLHQSVTDNAALAIKARILGLAEIPAPTAAARLPAVVIIIITRAVIALDIAFRSPALFGLTLKYWL
ncbi:hypothetical protein EVAR_88658_1 [Eumeta japonica]|uniref:Uncharacterized protein n=1 Tax=Eumeta variegata TaxID=151549 RepID=A0A4C1YA67_EUMVA|nr:hypothetical protein EVAR_88658_1 [Eumeta japonica]